MECVLDQQIFTCRILIAAPGADLTALRPIGLSPKVNKPDGVAIRQYYRSTHGPKRPCFFLNEEFLPGYAWIFPMGNNYYNVGCGRFLSGNAQFKNSLAEAFDKFLERDPIAKELLAHADEATPIRGASLRCRMADAESARRDRVLLVGEAIGTTIPGWGEGISKAMETGLLAAEVVAEAIRAKDFDLLKEYPRRLAREIQPDIARHRRVTFMFDRVWTANLLVSLARKPLLRRLLNAG
jgi:flavin-dependent dehydrogenase